MTTIAGIRLTKQSRRILSFLEKVQIKEERAQPGQLNQVLHLIHSQKPICAETSPSLLLGRNDSNILIELNLELYLH